LHQIFREGWQWASEKKQFKFGDDPTDPDPGKTCLGGGIHWPVLLVLTVTFSVGCDVVSSSQKGTKNALETGRTFATLFADMDLRLRLLVARTEAEFKILLREHMKELAEEQSDGNSRRKLSQDSREQKAEEALPRVENKAVVARWTAMDMSIVHPNFAIRNS